MLKQTRPGYKNPDVIIKSYPIDRRTCVMTVLKEYLKQTHELRANTRQLFISYIKPYKAVSNSTISRWIKEILHRAGIDIKQFGAHSVRSASTSKAKLNNVSVSDIMDRAGWSNVKTFASFYDKRIVCNNFDITVLNQNS